jgi:hypothetical protein
MKPYKKFKNFQFRWKEALGKEECPYLYRWTLILFGRSFRLHHWLRSDDNRYFHDHACDLTSIILKGHYYNCVPESEHNLDTRDCKKIPVKAGSIWKAKAWQKHYLEIPEGGAWTLLIQGKAYHKWGFYVNNNPKKPEYYHKWRPLRYFHKFGTIQTADYTGLEHD